MEPLKKKEISYISNFHYSHCANAAAFLVNADIELGKILTNNKYCIKATIIIQLNDANIK